MQADREPERTLLPEQVQAIRPEQALERIRASIRIRAHQLDMEARMAVAPLHTEAVQDRVRLIPAQAIRPEAIRNKPLNVIIVIHI